MRYCHHCHEEILETATVCPFCGAAVSIPEAPVLAPEAEPESAAPPPAPPATPTDAQGWSDLAVRQVEGGEILAAFRSFQEALALAPRDAETWFRIGGAYCRLSAFRHAQAAFARARQCDAHHSRAAFWEEQTKTRVAAVDPPVPEILPGLAQAAGPPAVDVSAHPMRRAAALALDLGLLLFCLCMVFSAAQAVFFALWGEGLYEITTEPSGNYGFVVGYFALLYFSLSHAAAGQTPGMMLCGIRLVNRRREAPGFIVAFLRTLVFFLLFCLSLFSALIMRGSSLHDALAGTHVVEAE